MPIHPNKLKATRPRYEAAGGKSDGFDAFVLAELARTDSHRHRALAPNSDETKALRALTRTREDLVGARVRLANELRAQLDAFWPGAARIFADVDSPIALAFLERYPAPADARGLGEKRLEGFLARNGYCGRRSRRRAAGAAAHRARRVAPGRWRPRRGEERCSAWWRPCGRSSPDPRAHLPDRRGGARPSRRAGLPAALQGPQVGDHRGAAGRRDRRRPRALPDAGGARRRRRHGAGGAGVGQAQGRRLSLGLRQAAARRRRPALPTPPATPIPGRGRSTSMPAPAASSTPRDQGSRPRLAARSLALLAGLTAPPPRGRRRSGRRPGPAAP